MLSCYISHYIPKIYWLNPPFWGKILVFLVSSQDFHHPLPKWQGLVFLSPASPCHRRGAMVEATWWILFFGSELDSAVERLVSFLGKKKRNSMVSRKRPHCLPWIAPWLRVQNFDDTRNRDASITKIPEPKLPKEEMVWHRPKKSVEAQWISSTVPHLSTWSGCALLSLGDILSRTVELK